MTTRSSLERRELVAVLRLQRRADTGLATLEVSQRWYLPRSNWLSVWNSGTFWKSPGGELRNGLNDLVVGDLMPRRRYSASSTLSLDELLPDLVLDLASVLQPEGAGRLLLPVVDGPLHRGLEGPGVDALAVDLADGGGGDAVPVPLVIAD